MARKSTSPLPTNVLDDSASLWRFLISNAGIDPEFFDRELLNGIGTGQGLCHLLKIPESNFKDFEKQLVDNAISVEQLVVAIFQSIEPYSQMMSDLCKFFETHLIKTTSKSLSISFDFSKLEKSQLNFDLEHFKEIVERLQHASTLVTFYKLNSNQLWRLPSLFSDDLSVRTSNSIATQWLDVYNHQEVYSRPDFTLPTHLSERFTKQLEKAMRVWRSFVNACRRINPNVQGLKEQSHRLNNEKSTQALTEPWTPSDLIWAATDRWPATFLNCLFFRLDELSKLDSQNRTAEEEGLANKIEAFFDSLDQSELDESELVRDLAELLRLPIWKHRYELYAAWILSVIDRALEEYPREIHHQNGLLELSFKATHIATIGTIAGPHSLWSEVRSPLANPAGKSRKANIQPDYGIYQQMNSLPDQCKIAIEVKQYRRGGNANFAAAMNDYARGLPNAEIVLVNYESMPKNLDLADPDRSHPLGHIRPNSDALTDFISLLKAQIPAPHVNRFKNLNAYVTILLTGLEIDSLIVDVSKSLDSDEYRSFLKTLLSEMLQGGQVKKLIAADVSVRGDWTPPTVEDIEDVLALTHCGGATEFTSLISPTERVVVITDDDGLRSMEFNYNTAEVIVFERINQLII